MAAFSDPTFHQPRSPANPRLLKALASAAVSTDNAVKMGLYEALLNATLIIPTVCKPIDAAPISTPQIGRGKGQEFLLVEDEQGAAVPGFTDIQAMQRWSPGATSFISLPLTQFLRESFPSAASGIWLNLADRSARFVSRAELAQFTGGMVQATYTQQVERELAPLHGEFIAHLPETLPAEMIQRIVDSLRREPDVASGFIIQVTTVVKGDRVALGIRVSRLLEPPVVEGLLKRVARSINESRWHRGTIDVLVLDYAKFKSLSGVVPAIFERS